MFRSRHIHAGGELGAHIAGLVGDGAHQAREVDRGERFVGGDVAAELQRGADHGQQLVEVRLHLGAQFLILDELGAQLQPCDRRLEVVADGGEHEGAVGDEAADARGHGVEGARRLDDFERAGLRQGGGVDVPAQAVGGGGEQADRADEAPRCPDDEHGRGHRHQGEGIQERARMPGAGRGQRHLDIEPALVGHAHADMQPAEALAAQQHQRARAHPLGDRHQLHLGPQQPLRLLGQGRHVALRQVLQDARVHAALLAVIGDEVRALVGGGEDDVAIQHQGADQGGALIGLNLQADPVERVDGEAGDLHRREGEQQDQRRASGKGRGPESDPPRSGQTGSRRGGLELPLRSHRGCGRPSGGRHRRPARSRRRARS